MAKIQIQKALEKHTLNLNSVAIFSPQYYYAQAMIARCKEALLIADNTKAWKHFIG